MDFKYNTYAKYLAAYTYLLAVLEDFSYIRDMMLITVTNPDEELTTRLESFK